MVKSCHQGTVLLGAQLALASPVFLRRLKVHRSEIQSQDFLVRQIVRTLPCPQLRQQRPMHLLARQGMKTDSLPGSLCTSTSRIATPAAADDMFISVQPSIGQYYGT
jgi:hypothetical protein